MNDDKTTSADAPDPEAQEQPEQQRPTEGGSYIRQKDGSLKKQKNVQRPKPENQKPTT